MAGDSGAIIALRPKVMKRSFSGMLPGAEPEGLKVLKGLSSEIQYVNLVIFVTSTP